MKVDRIPISLWTTPLRLVNGRGGVPRARSGWSRALAS